SYPCACRHIPAGRRRRDSAAHGRVVAAPRRLTAEKIPDSQVKSIDPLRSRYRFSQGWIPSQAEAGRQARRGRRNPTARSGRRRGCVRPVCDIGGGDGGCSTKERPWHGSPPPDGSVTGAGAALAHLSPRSFISMEGLCLKDVYSSARSFWSWWRVDSSASAA